MELRARTSRGVVAKPGSDAGSVQKAEATPAGGDDGHSERSEGLAKRVRRVPAQLQFPLVVVLSFAISALSYSLLGELTKGEIASVSRSLDTPGEVAIITLWRICELALGWFGNFDSYDLAALNVLSHGPPLYLLATFYEVSPVTALSAVAIDVLSTAIPFQLLRPLSGAHAGGASVANREIIADPAIQVYTTALAAIVYTVTLLVAYRLYLPAVLILNFEGLKTLIPAYSSSYLSVLPGALLFGLAAKTFIFTPFAATGPAAEDEKLKDFNPVEASLGETAWYNVWGYTAQTKVVIVRTAVAVVMTYVSTYLQTWLTIAGVQSAGAQSYSIIWATAALLTGLGLGLVGRP